MSRHPGGSDSAPPPTQFLSRWSRRKAAARESGVTDPLATPARAPATHDPSKGPADETLPAAGNEIGNPVQAEGAEQPIPDDPIPPLESLTESSDFSRFMRADVPAEIRKLALRKMFQSPIFNLRDGLDDYDDDYTSFEPLGDLVTADMRYHTEREQAERDRAAEQAAQAESAAAEQAPGPDESGEAATAKAEDDRRGGDEPVADDDTDKSPSPRVEAGLPGPEAGSEAAPDADALVPAPGARSGKLRRRLDTDR